MKAETIRVRGTVQGVGFRPWVWNLARRLGLRGRVLNDAEGVLIQAWGSPEALEALVAGMQSHPPPLAQIEAVERTPLEAGGDLPGEFSIVESRGGETRTAVAADAATCRDCLTEIFDPGGRRYRYPFTNCTHCGPRLSILRRIPYDRVNTSMAAFVMCERCQAEYDDPSNRRFHAQPNACPDCGPRVWLEDGGGKPAGESPFDAIRETARWITAGRIVAIKGIGGIHLACDAANEAAVAELRCRKQRYHKAFALMARDPTMIGRYAHLDESATAVLSSVAAPIVILDARGGTLPPSINPGQRSLGFMLPYTPLHHLLMASLDAPIVLTSGNRSDEPQCIGNKETREKLAAIADGFLFHDREIVTRLDDSVVRIMAGRPRLLRRARGFAPEPMPLPKGFGNSPRVLAMGTELKNNFCLLADGRAVISQHLGDLEDAATLREYRRMLNHYQSLYDFEPEIVVVDRHPNYLSSQIGRQLAQERGVPLIEVQHHHAHMASCMAEHGLPTDTGPVLGVILDGLGYGDDGTLWGAEFLLGGYRGCRRLVSFQSVPMPGGAMAVREPWRNTLAYLSTVLDWREVKGRWPGLELIRFLGSRPVATLQAMMGKGINSPRASSAGRLFDAVAVALDICREQVSFEGQAAIELEALAEDADADSGYPFELKEDRILWAGMWRGILDDLAAGVSRPVIAAKFHKTVAGALAETAAGLCSRHQTDTLVLSGGVFQNRLLLESVVQQVRSKGLHPLVPEALPANDGGISLGQAIIGAMLAPSGKAT